MGGRLELAFLQGTGGREARETLLNVTDHHGNAMRVPARQHCARVRTATIRTGGRQALGRAQEPSRVPRGRCQSALKLPPAVLPPGLAGGHRSPWCEGQTSGRSAPRARASPHCLSRPRGGRPAPAPPVPGMQPACHLAWPRREKRRAWASAQTSRRRAWPVAGAASVCPLCGPARRLCKSTCTCTAPGCHTTRDRYDAGAVEAATPAWSPSARRASLLGSQGANASWGSAVSPPPTRPSQGCWAFLRGKPG